MRMVIDVQGGLVQDVSIELKTGDALVVPEVMVRDHDVEGREEDDIITDESGSHVLILMPVAIRVVD